MTNEAEQYFMFLDIWIARLVTYQFRVLIHFSHLFLVDLSWYFLMSSLTFWLVFWFSKWCLFFDEEKFLTLKYPKLLIFITVLNLFVWWWEMS